MDEDKAAGGRGVVMLYGVCVRCLYGDEGGDCADLRMKSVRRRLGNDGGLLAAVRLFEAGG